MLLKALKVHSYKMADKVTETLCATVARSGEAAESTDSEKAAECGGGISRCGAPAYGPPSREEPQLHPQHREGEEGSIRGG